jgi:hypothetical protein
MAFLNRDQVKNVVLASLRVVADLPPGDVEQASFAGFNDFQEHIFLSALKSKLNALPYYKNNGQETYAAYYDVDLMPDSIDNWPTVKDCIDWVVENQKVVYLN